MQAAKDCLTGEKENEETMSELLSQLWTPELQTALQLVVGVLVVLYVLSIVWVVRDAYLRGSFWFIWAAVALVPLVGVIAYCLLRPPLLQIDRDEQELEIALKQRELMKYGECANCGFPVESDYAICPNCHTQLKNLCGGCNKALDPAWTVCPYCTTPLGSPSPRRSSTAAASVRTRSTSTSSSAQGAQSSSTSQAGQSAQASQSSSTSSSVSQRSAARQARARTAASRDESTTGDEE
ncbi:MAG: zinc ribbon domain-containing protein [Eggerthellaceae bacterium]|jgi:RNA polymerase subunit RPABC4/transcription elongation factor Spt4|nr:zinc ribbon domain-containing protein [Eggerthellaceae bacterium]MDR2721726.1 zinc ribbon domain-containing protein [Coriobacteriaceae bacterium]